jgi:hypothetical protein
MLSTIKNFYATYGYFYFKIWALHLGVLLSLLLVDIQYFFIAILIFLLLMPLQQLVIHEYISHGYIKPKNQYVDLVVLLFLFYVYGSTTTEKKNYHMTHHRLWKDSNTDPTQQKINAVPFWRYVLGFHRPLIRNLDSVKNTLQLDNRWVKIFESRSKKIFLLYSAAMFIFLPIEWFIVCCVYYPWLNLIIFNTHDQVFHGKTKIKDSSWYLPVFGNQAWHVQHHERYMSDYYGPGLIKWLNLAYYYRLLLFTSTKPNMN